MPEAQEYGGVIPAQLENLQNVDHNTAVTVGDVLVVTAVDQDGTVHWKAGTTPGASVPIPTTGDAGKLVTVNQAEDGYDVGGVNDAIHISADGNLAFNSQWQGVVLMSPDGQLHRITVTNDGTLGTVGISPS